MFSARSGAHNGDLLLFVPALSAVLLRPSLILLAAVESRDQLREQVAE